jgi:hypothetical protein
MADDVEILAACLKMLRDRHMANRLLRDMMLAMQRRTEYAEQQNLFLAQSLISMHLNIGHVLNSIGVYPPVIPTHLPSPFRIAHSTPGQHPWPQNQPTSPHGHNLPTLEVTSEPFPPFSNVHITCIQCRGPVNAQNTEEILPTCNR